MHRTLFSFLILVLLIGGMGLAAAQDDPQALEGQIVFLSRRTEAPEIWLIDLATRELTQLTDRPHTDWAPAWSPDGQQVIFHAMEPDTRNWDIWVMDPDGANLVNLTNHGGLDMLPVFSPDGTQIAFVSNRDDVAGDNRDIYLMNADGTGVERLTDAPGHDIDPAWSPDGTRIAFASQRSGEDGSAIYVFDLATREETVLVDFAGASDGAPDWSPDGEWLVFASDSAGTYDIYRISAAGGEVEVLVDTIGGDRSPAYSPDGEWIVFYSDMVEESNYDIFIVRADGTGDIIQVTDDPEWDTTPSWRPVVME